MSLSTAIFQGLVADSGLFVLNPMPHMDSELFLDPLFYPVFAHTATAFHVYEQLEDKSWVIVATADPSKFDGLIEPLIGRRVPVSHALQTLLEKPNTIIRVNANLQEIMAKVNGRLDKRKKND